MARQTGFFDKLLQRLERLDPENLQAQFMSLVRDRGFLETVFQSIQEGIIVVSETGRLQYANRASENMLGFDCVRMRGRSVRHLFPDIEWELLARRDEEEWARLITSEIEVAHPVRRILSFYAIPLAVSEDSEAGGVLAMLRDVTREREQEATLLESERLQAAWHLAASVAHEIGNPLNALGIHLQLLDREVRALPREGSEDLRELVTVARDEVARLDLIITQFLGALRPSAPDLAKGNVAELLQETLRVMRPEIENRRILVSLLHPDEVPAVYIDRGQIKQVFFNILRNALQAMPDAGRLTIAISSDERSLAVAVRDTGTGIPREEFRRMFEPYRTTKAKGHGLGLMIVQRIIQDHGGQIEVASKQGEGTVFRIVLPLADRRIRLLSERSSHSAAGADKSAVPSGAAEDIEEVVNV